MEILFGNKGIYHYMDAKVGTMRALEEDGRMFRLQMLVENQVPYLLPSAMLCDDGEVWLTHNTGQCYILSAYLQQKAADGVLLRKILSQIMECSEIMEAYLLDPGDLVIHAEYMFFDEQQQEIRMLCIPGHQYPLKQALREFAEYLMPRFDHGDREGERFLYEMYRLLSDEREDLSEFAARLKDGTGGIGIPAESEQTRDRVGRQERDRKQNRDVVPPENDQVRPEKGEEREVHFGKTGLFVIGGGAGLALIVKYLFFDGTLTTAIFGILWLIALIVAAVMTIRDREEEDVDAAMRAYEMQENPEIPNPNPGSDSVKIPPVPQACCKSAKLIPLTNGAVEAMKIPLSEQPLTVGRDKHADYRVAAEQISRLHAKIFCRADGLYIQDQNSTNGTYLNSERLPAMQMHRLAEGDVIGFANEEFFVSMQTVR